MVKIITFHKNITYIGTEKGAHILKNEETTATKINGIDENVWTIEIINNDIYFGTDFGAYVLKNGETNPKQINEVGKRKKTH